MVNPGWGDLDRGLFSISVAAKLAGLHPRVQPRLPQAAIRVRMALSYWGLFVVSGAVLLAATLALWEGKTVTTVHVTGRAASPGVTIHGSDLGQLLILSGIALGVMAAVSVMFGWLVAGRFLAPVRAIAATARRISATSLHERLSLQGPDDELKELADTIDELLARLERSFESERRFAASASRELRTPWRPCGYGWMRPSPNPGPCPRRPRSCQPDPGRTRPRRRAAGKPPHSCPHPAGTG